MFVLINDYLLGVVVICFCMYLLFSFWMFNRFAVCRISRKRSRFSIPLL